MVKKPAYVLAMVRNLGCFSTPERAADAIIMDDNVLLVINNRNEGFIFHNLNRFLYVSKRQSD